MSILSDETKILPGLNEIIIAGTKVDKHELQDLIEKEIKVADQCIRFLELIGVKHIFGIQSSSNLPLYDALCASEIRLIVPKNEAGAGYSVSKYAGVSGNLGVCILAGTVGLNNAIGGIGEAFVNKSSVLIISGSPSRARLHRGGIQNLDTISVTQSITKHSCLVNREEDVLPELLKAAVIATTPPFGPVHISIPVDIQCCTVSNVSKFTAEIDPFLPAYDRSALNAAIDLIDSVDAGIIYAGHGAKKYSSLLKDLARKLGWPVIATPRGKGILEDDFELYMGNYGMFCADFTKQFVEEYKPGCLLILGTGLKEVSITDFDDRLLKDKKIIHIDSDRKELNKVFEVDLPVYFDLGMAFPALIAECQPKPRVSFQKTMFNQPYKKNHSGASVRYFLEQLSEYFPEKSIILSDIGEFMTFVFKYLPIKKDLYFDISTNYAAMGNAVGGSLGACLSLPDYQTIVITGDGGFFMNGMEILTAHEYNLPIIYVIINNAMLGFVVNGLKVLMGRTNDHAMQKRIELAEMYKVAGIPGLTIRENEDLAQIPGFISGLDGPCIIELVIDNSEQSPMMDRLLMLKQIYDV
ncbi:MAG: thiamine pyrophosphate-binding protein [Deltaproteobacteria bacterium]|nr:thiamine pyrophosphate-binding protein [Deltaproteobacteria bacterium]